MTFSSYFFSFAVVVLLSGCGVSRKIGISDLDWQPPILASDGCPNLSGDYSYILNRYPAGGYSSNLLSIYSGSGLILSRTARTSAMGGYAQIPISKSELEMHQSYYDYYVTDTNGKILKSNETSDAVAQPGVFFIRQNEGFLFNGVGSMAKVVTNLRTDFSGCHGGALVLRRIENYGGREFVPRTIRYGELEMKVEHDGALHMTQRWRRRNVSFASGLLGDLKEEKTEIRVYPMIKK